MSFPGEEWVFMCIGFAAGFWCLREIIRAIRHDVIRDGHFMGMHHRKDDETKFWGHVFSWCLYLVLCFGVSFMMLRDQLAG
ncbi:hypothetical protein [Stenotrophomonas panacihumi]|uniref:hypothetical protein n=1 Tax=Stenotrophomonas panacihumi TaxID=676599 RepID=UPI000B17F2D3|nr:hypothetical protein [Stenotrophomonas panacihumi]